MKRIFLIGFAVLLLCAFSAQAAEVYAPGQNGTGTIGKPDRYWGKGYFKEVITGNFSPSIATIVMATVDYTLSAAEALCNILVVTGSPSGQGIIAPSISASGVSRLYTVRNAGTEDVVIKVSGGTGVTVGTGKTAKVFWSGSDYVRETADATH